MSTKEQDNTSKMESQLNPLSQTARIKAQRAAKAAVLTLAGDKPKRGDYNNVSTSDYPAWVTGIVLFLCFVMLIAAFLPSAFRLYDEGSKTFEQSISDTTKAQIAGVAVVLLAETGAVLFTLALSVLRAEGSMRWTLSSAALLSGVIAIVGNMAVAIFRHEVFTNLFVWLEALAPPLLTLATAYVLKGVALNAISQRHKDNRLYETALKTWEHETANVEAHPQYLQYVANELRDAIWKANKAKKTRDMLKDFTPEQWSKAVWEELAKDNWYQDHSPRTNGERTNKANKGYSFAPNERTANIGSEREYSEQANERRTNGYHKNMSARDHARQFFMENRQYIDGLNPDTGRVWTNDELQPLVSQWAEQNIGRTSVYEGRKEAAQFIALPENQDISVN